MSLEKQRRRGPPAHPSDSISELEAVEAVRNLLREDEDALKNFWIVPFLSFANHSRELTSEVYTEYHVLFHMENGPVVYAG